jgi:hypothetical protein
MVLQQHAMMQMHIIVVPIILSADRLTGPVTAARMKRAHATKKTSSHANGNRVGHVCPGCITVANHHVVQSTKGSRLHLTDNKLQQACGSLLLGIQFPIAT